MRLILPRLSHLEEFRLFVGHEADCKCVEGLHEEIKAQAEAALPVLASGVRPRFLFDVELYEGGVNFSDRQRSDVDEAAEHHSDEAADHHPGENPDENSDKGSDEGCDEGSDEVSDEGSDGDSDDDSDEGDDDYTSDDNSDDEFYDGFSHGDETTLYDGVLLEAMGSSALAAGVATEGYRHQLPGPDYSSNEMPSIASEESEPRIKKREFSFIEDASIPDGNVASGVHGRKQHSS